MMDNYLSDILTMLQSHENPEEATKMKKYLKNQFDFFGVKAPVWRGLMKDFFATHQRPSDADVQHLVKLLWKQPQRECQYCALNVLNKWFVDFDRNSIFFIEFLIDTKSWWDTIDGIAPSVFGLQYLDKFPAERDVINERWISSDNFWFRRSALLFQLKYKQKTDTALLFDNINRCLGSKEFFVNKAIGWMLREYSKTAPELIIKFIKTTHLHPLSKREGLKYLLKNGYENE